MSRISFVLFILKARWKLLGHILQMDPECPANKAMEFYFEKTDFKKSKGHPRTTIFTTLNRDIQRTRQKDPTFSLEKFTIKEDLQQIYKLAEDREG